MREVEHPGYRGRAATGNGRNGNEVVAGAAHDHIFNDVR